MLYPVACNAELLPVGGPGRFILADSASPPPWFLEEYAGKAQVIYLDPPFGTGDAFSYQAVSKGKRVAIPAYSDKLGMEDYLPMMRSVLSLSYELLSPNGSIYVHVDYRMSAQIRLLLDEIFKPSNFVNEIIWAYKSGGRSTRHYSRKHDAIFLYRKSARAYFDISAVGVPRGPERRNHMRRGIDEQGRIYFSIRSGKKTYKYYEDQHVYPSDVWDDIEHLHQRDPERTGYSTQKPEALLRRVILASSRPGDLVMDLFSGSGTTAAVAASLQRPWAAMDASGVALCILRERLVRANASVSMLESGHAMRLDHSGAQRLPWEGLLRQDSGQGATLTLFEGAPDIAYFALGRIRDGCFYPETYQFSPMDGAALHAGGEETVAELCDVSGRHIFLKLG